MIKYIYQFMGYKIGNTIHEIFSYLYRTLRVLRYSRLKENASLEDIQVLHYSENFIVVNKRYDVRINSNDPEHKVTVQTQLRKIAPELINPRLGHDFYVLHRLDYATSGILCIPTNKQSCKLAVRAFQNRLVEKYYLAIVRGHISQEILDIDLGIGDDTRPEFQGIRMTVEGRPYVEKTRPAFTRILVLERGISHGYPATKVLLKPITGRRHQLRLHLSVLGHTIVGDYTYSNRKDVKPYRMFLHAFRLVIPTAVENLGIQTTDPFCEDNPQNQWQRVEVVNALNDNAMVLITEAEASPVEGKVSGNEIQAGRSLDSSLRIFFKPFL